METFIQAFIVAFREGMEAFLIIAILLKFLEKTNHSKLKKSVWQGMFAGIIASFALGIGLFALSLQIGGQDATAKLWESVASFVAVILITTFIIWMINHADNIKGHIENKAFHHLSKKGLFVLTMFMVAREGAEIAVFSFAGKYQLVPIALGIAVSVLFAMLIYKSLVKFELKTVFSITLAYLILQAGFLLGYSIHEGLSASANIGLIAKDNQLFTKAFDFSDTVLNHKEGTIGLPLYVLFGWYSKPEWIQLIAQYSYTIILFGYWLLNKKHKNRPASHQKND